MYFLWKVGEKALLFIIVYSIVSTVLVAMFLSLNMRPPDIVLCTPITPKEVETVANRISGTPNLAKLPQYAFDIVVVLKNFAAALLIGIPKFFYELAKMTGVPALVVGATFLGAVLHLSGILYFTRLLLKLIYGGW